ncbi:MAG: ACP S-malonyltransferase [Endomicrobia bacterium]|nr:ACP S-malonyltransferase [Endomicrobiia bacterium]
MTKLAIIYPGQGSQSVGMGYEFYSNFEFVKFYYEKANEILGYDIKKIIFEGPQEILSQTIYTQPAMFLTSYVIFECLKNEIPQILNYIKFVAGHSLGEYTAICSCGVLSFEDTLQIVNERAKIMHEVGHKKSGGMIAVIGLAREKLINYCNEIRNQGMTIEPVNFNTPQQIVVAGEIPAINELQTILNKEKIKCIKLNVSGAFHSSLMNEAQKIFSQTLDKLNLNNAFIPIIMNFDAKPHINKDEILYNMKMQINHPVLWEESIKYIYNDGVKIFVECGPGKVLSNMVKKIVPEAEVFTVSDISTLKTTLENLKQILSQTTG